MSLIPVAQAQARLLDAVTVLSAETIPLDQCGGRWLADNLYARRGQPWADLSAMDGYAIRHADLPGPWKVLGESAAGDATLPTLGSGQAMRIFTGAPLPFGADMVVMQEDIERDGGVAMLATGMTLQPGAHVRRVGTDFRSGQLLIEKGARLTAPRIALAAIGGHGALLVGRMPRVAILSTGNELVEPGQSVQPGHLPASNGVMLAAMLMDLPCEVEQFGIVPDSLDALTQAFHRAKSADVVVTTGGASVGDHDLVRPALEAAGGAIDFWRIAMRPGKPLIAGRVGTAAMLGLPGNPVSAFATATLFLLPMIRKLAGCPSPLPSATTARLGRPIDGNGTSRDAYLRGMVENDVVTALDDQDSAGLLALSWANCFILHRAGADAVGAGASIELIPFP